LCIVVDLRDTTATKGKFIAFQLYPAVAKYSCRSGRLAAIAPEDGAPAGWSQNLTISEFQNQDTRIHFIL